MMLEREIGRAHAEELLATRRRHHHGRVRAGLAARLHRLAERLETRVDDSNPAYDA